VHFRRHLYRLDDFRRPAARGSLFLLYASTLLTCGCTGFWDDVTSKEFSFKGMFVKPDPMVVLRDSQDGDKRARALRALREPKQNGGSDQDQDAVVRILTTAAVSEKQSLCRLAAIQALGGFKDPRAADALKEAFFTASGFAPDTTTLLRCQAISALGRTGNPAAVDLLVRVVREPPADGTELEKQQSLDVRIAAARALGRFNQPQSVQALASVLHTEKDIALRDRAHESLQLVTGRKLPADAKEWDEVVQAAANGTTADDQSKKFKLMSWFPSFDH
jgi:HEAT repeat protein